MGHLLYRLDGVLRASLCKYAFTLRDRRLFCRQGNPDNLEERPLQWVEKQNGRLEDTAVLFLSLRFPTLWWTGILLHHPDGHLDPRVEAELA